MLWLFLICGLREFALTQRVDAISVTTHGASVALLDCDGKLAAPVLDYEHDGPDHLAAEYDATRPDFAESGSPRLPMGLNAGAQIFWQFKTFPDIRARTKTILTYPHIGHTALREKPRMRSHRLAVIQICGVRARRVSHLLLSGKTGCH